MWNNPAGWISVVRHLREIGYDVYCIDKEPVIGIGNTWNYAPIGAIDLTGNIPIRDRAQSYPALICLLAWLLICRWRGLAMYPLL